MVFIPKSGRGYWNGKVNCEPVLAPFRIQLERKQVCQRPIQMHVVPDSFSLGHKNTIMSNDVPVPIPKTPRFPSYDAVFDIAELVDPMCVPL